MRRTTGFLLLCAALTSAGAGAMGCDGGAQNGPSDGGTDGSGPFNPGFPAVVPKVQRGAGALLLTPRVVPIFFPSDAMQGSLNAFLVNYVTSAPSYTALQEYGINRGTVTPAVVLSPAPAAMTTDTAIQSLLVAKIGDGTLPRPDGNTLYNFFYPANVTITRGGIASCTAFLAYHGMTKLGDGTPAPYTVIPRCQPSLQILTIATSHEFQETVTDPLLTSYLELNEPYSLWELPLAGAEITDMCQNLTDFFVVDSSAGAVSRLWSNAAITAYHNPCLPAPKGPSFLSVPVLPETGQVNLAGRIRNVEQVSISVGQSRNIPVRLVSDTMPGPSWSVQAMETPLATTGGTPPPALSLSWVEAPGQNKAQGQAGATLNLSIKANTTTPSGYTSVVLLSTLSLGGGQTTQSLWVVTVVLKP